MDIWHFQVMVWLSGVVFPLMLSVCVLVGYARRPQSFRIRMVGGVVALALGGAGLGGLSLILLSRLECRMDFGAFPSLHTIMSTVIWAFLLSCDSLCLSVGSVKWVLCRRDEGGTACDNTYQDGSANAKSDLNGRKMTRVLLIVLLVIWSAIHGYAAGVTIGS